MVRGRRELCRVEMNDEASHKHAGFSVDVCQQTEEKPSSYCRLLNAAETSWSASASASASAMTLSITRHGKKGRTLGKRVSATESTFQSMLPQLQSDRHDRVCRHILFCLSFHLFILTGLSRIFPPLASSSLGSPFLHIVSFESSSSIFKRNVLPLSCLSR